MRTLICIFHFLMAVITVIPEKAEYIVTKFNVLVFKQN
jgi:hypothetical protein